MEPGPGACERDGRCVWVYLAIAAVFAMGAASYFVRLGDIDRIQEENCRSANEAKTALVRVMDESVALRYAAGDPAAEAFERSYERLKRQYLVPHVCGG